MSLFIACSFWADPSDFERCLFTNHKLIVIQVLLETETRDSVMQISISVMLKKDLGGNTDLMQVLLETETRDSVMQISIVLC